MIISAGLAELAMRLVLAGRSIDETLGGPTVAVTGRGGRRIRPPPPPLSLRSRFR